MPIFGKKAFGKGAKSGPLPSFTQGAGAESAFKQETQIFCPSLIICFVIAREIRQEHVGRIVGGGGG